jgi:hypothetical protein
VRPASSGFRVEVIAQEAPMSNQMIPLTNARSSSGGLFGSAPQRALQRELEYTVGHAQIAQVHEQARGALTNEVLEIAGSLSALESHLIQIAPIGEARYKAIVDSFVLGAANSIARL